MPTQTKRATAGTVTQLNTALTGGHPSIIHMEQMMVHHTTAGTIPATEPEALRTAPDGAAAFHLVADMELPLHEIGDLVTALHMLTVDMEDINIAGAINTLVAIIGQRTRSADDARCKAFHVLHGYAHPHREARHG